MLITQKEGLLMRIQDALFPQNEKKVFFHKLQRNTLTGKWSLEFTPKAGGKFDKELLRALGAVDGNEDNTVLDSSASNTAVIRWNGLLFELSIRNGCSYYVREISGEEAAQMGKNIVDIAE